MCILANFFFYLELVSFMCVRVCVSVCLCVCLDHPWISHGFVYRDTKKPHPTASTTAVTATAGHIFGSCKRKTFPNNSISMLFEEWHSVEFPKINKILMLFSVREYFMRIGFSLYWFE